MLHSFRLFITGSALMLCLACGKLGELQPTPAHTPTEPSPGPNELWLKAHGVTCFQLRWAAGELVTDPFWSWQSMPALAFRKLQTDSARVEAAAQQMRNVRYIVVGHAHYDHAQDLPYLLRLLPDDVQVLGSQTLQHLLAPYGLAARVVPMDSLAGVPGQAGTPWYAPDSSFRAFAFRSHHVPHIFGIHIAHKKLQAPRKKPPVRSSHWVDGGNLSFWMEWGSPASNGAYSVRHRVFFMDGVSTFPNGLPDVGKLGTKVDAAIVSCALHNKANGYPQGLFKTLDADRWVLCHWESFFRSRDKPLKPLMMTNVQAFTDTLHHYEGKPAEPILPGLRRWYRLK